MLTRDPLPPYPPVLDKEYFEFCLKRAKSFAVWVQVNPALQRLVPISREDAIDIATDGLRIMPIWGMLNDDCLELSLTSQWLDSIAAEKEQQEAEKERLEAIRILDGMKQ